jgi:predicted peptidase
VAVRRNPERFHGDPTASYLTGLSKGRLAPVSREGFTAIAPICGGIIRPISLPNAEVALIWEFHGSAEKRLSAENSRRLVKALKEIGSVLKYTE